MATGILPSGRRTTTAAILDTDILNTWNSAVLPGTLPRAGGSVTLLTPNDYFFDRFGSQGNRAPLVVADREMNQFKGRIFNGVDPQDTSDRGPFHTNLQSNVRTGTGETELLAPLRMVSATTHEAAKS